MRRFILILIILLPLQASAATGTSEWLLFMGRFHPVILHLPIGFLILAFLMELFGRFRKYGMLKHSVEFILLLGMITSALAATFGYFLSLEGGYNEELLNLHMWSGIVLTLLSVLLYISRRTLTQMSVPWLRKIYPYLFILVITMLTATGHFGGTLTHGEDYLTRNMPESLKKLAGLELKENRRISSIGNAVVYHDLIQPILDSKCISCHNTSKTKGELQLLTPESITKGGESGKILIPGNPDESDIIRRISLPLDHEDHMPPEGKIPLTSDEIKLIHWWIENGASFEDTVKNFAQNETIGEVLAKVEKRITRETNPVFKKNVSEVDNDDISELKEMGIHVTPLSEGSAFVQARVDTVPENIGSALRAIRDQLVWLDLSGTSCSDEHLRQLSGFDNLVRLYVQNTSISDEGLDYLADKEYLEYLNLFGTPVTDEGLKSLRSLKRLKNIYLWQTSVTPEGTEVLKASIPDLHIDLGINISNLDTVRVAQPLLKYDSRMFRDTTKVEMEPAFDGSDIFYTVDGSEPTTESQLYRQPVKLDSSCTIKAMAIKEGWADSHVVSVDFIKMRKIPESIRLVNPPDEKYKGEGPSTLINGTLGSANFREGEWLGFHETDYVAYVDLGEYLDINKVRVRFLEDIDSFIFLPTQIVLSVSSDGKLYSSIGNKKLELPDKSRPLNIQQYIFDIPSEKKIRYIKVHARNAGRCPDWHPGAGDKAWVFTDEVIVE